MNRSLRGAAGAVVAVSLAALVWIPNSSTLGAEFAIGVPAAASELAERGPAQQPTPTTSTTTSTTTTVPTPIVTGFDSLFIGHSFFRPIALRMPDLAEAAGFSDHTQETVFAGGENGAPLALWNSTSRRAAIQAVLDRGDIELFGMTYHPAHPTLEGYQNWVDYALAQNPDTTFFLGFPWLTDPGTAYADAAEYRTTWLGAYDAIALPIIDSLRDEYPGVDFFAIPYGQATAELFVRYDDEDLPDIDTFVGNDAGSLFTDDFGHAGPLILDTAALVWLRAIYGVDLNTFEYDSGYITDIAAVATAIMDAHDPAYNAP